MLILQELKEILVRVRPRESFTKMFHGIQKLLEVMFNKDVSHLGGDCAMELRPYQHFAVNGIRHSLSAGNKRVMLYSPTGSGKSEIAISVAQGARSKGKRVAFLVDSIELVLQASRRFAKSGLPHGIIQGDNTRDVDDQLVICSIQTVAKRGLPPVDMLIIDEAHKCAGRKAYHQLIRRHNNLPIIGLSATPFTRGLGSHNDVVEGKLFEDMVVASTIKDLIDQGYLVDCEIYAPGAPNLQGVRVVAGDYDQAQLAARVDVDGLVGDIVQHWLRLGGNRQTVCFATNVAHSLHIQQKFLQAGVSCDHIDAKTPTPERQRILLDFSQGLTKVITNVAVLAEGWDCPAAEVMILARPTRSLVRYLQMAGRILRPAHGKVKARILDHSGTAVRLGFPTDDLPLQLDDGVAGEANHEARQEEQDKAAVCPQCHAVRPRGVRKCPGCGFEPKRIAMPVEAEDGVLVKLGKDQVKAKQRQEAYAELLWVARNRGFKDGWAYHLVKRWYPGYDPSVKPPLKDPTAATLARLANGKFRARAGLAGKIADNILRDGAAGIRKLVNEQR